MQIVSDPASRATRRPLIAHVVFRLDYGGLENGLVNLVNSMPEETYRHCIIALTAATDFRYRLQKADVTVFELNKRPGKGIGAHMRLFGLLRKLKPAILHSRNIGTLDCVPIARLAGVRACIHGEHGWDTHDPAGQNPKYRRLRKAVNPMVRKFIAVSSELEGWLTDFVGIPQRKVTRICNGVDTERFGPAIGDGHSADLSSRFPVGSVIVGSILRFTEIKDPMNLVEAFILAQRRAEQEGVRLCLAMIGDGPLRQKAIDAIREAKLTDSAWLPGSRDDVPELMRSFDLFVLGSRREGISNTLLEAMATGLPVIATDTGGNGELVRVGKVGVLVPTENPQALSGELLRYALDSGLKESQGRAARDLAVEEYSLDHMVRRYQRVYHDAVSGKETQD